MMSITITLRDGDRTVHEVRRFASRSDQVPGTVNDALGWLQSYTGQLSARQWDADVAHANGEEPELRVVA